MCYLVQVNSTSDKNVMANKDDASLSPLCALKRSVMTKFLNFCVIYSLDTYHFYTRKIFENSEVLGHQGIE